MSVEGNYYLYKKHGQTSGNARYQCKLYRKTFSDGNKRRRHRRSEINKSFFLHIVNKTPMRRMCEILDISSKTYFDKLNWLYEQYLAFARDREIRLLRATYAQKIDICTDRQVHISNWSDRKDKREYLRLGY
ncbi:MAG: transposase-like protein [Patiriisocius sp.]|jgi:transposase-like protein